MPRRIAAAGLRAPILKARSAAGRDDSPTRALLDGAQLVDDDPG